MIEKYHKPILALISKEGALGVNSIAKATDIPLSTVQRYLNLQQNYFRKNDERKWDLPERVNADITDTSLSLAVNVVENSILLIKTQLADVLNSVENALSPLNTVKRGIQNKPASVADTTPKVENELLESTLEQIDRLPSILKSKKENIPDELLKVLLNTKWLDLLLDYGRNYFKEVIEPDLYDLALGTSTELSEDTLSTIKGYQKN